MDLGDLPNRASKLITEWATRYKVDLLKMWQNKEFKPHPGLE